MSSIYIGGTIKITSSNRHPDADDLLIRTVDLDGLRIADIGASDGSTSVDLIERAGDFAEYTIADRYLTLKAVPVMGHTVMFSGEDCVLVCGSRLMAWPELSRGANALYSPLISTARRLTDRRGEEVLLLNPRTRAAIATDPRIKVREHDVFSIWPDPKPDVIKIANLLRRLYFSDDDLLRALHAVAESLNQGGVLMIVDNPRISNTPPRAGLWRKVDTRLVEIARVGEPEIADLVAKVDTGDYTHQSHQMTS